MTENEHDFEQRANCTETKDGGVRCEFLIVDEHGKTEMDIHCEERENEMMHCEMEILAPADQLEFSPNQNFEETNDMGA